MSNRGSSPESKFRWNPFKKNGHDFSRNQYAKKLTKAASIPLTVSMGLTGVAGAISPENSNAESFSSPAALTQPGILSSDVISNQLINKNGLGDETIRELTANAFPVNTNNPDFEKLREVDKQVAEGAKQRSWFWGSRITRLVEPFYEAQDGKREVEYDEKGIMAKDTDSPMKVAPTLAVKEMTEGKIQVGLNSFVDSSPSTETIIGDNDKEPTYKSFSNHLAPAEKDSSSNTIIKTLSKDGTVGEDINLQSHKISNGMYIEETKHNIAGVFWNFMNDSVEEFKNIGISVDPFFSTGFPITEPYWIKTTTNGAEKDVLVQLFEKRVLIYTPGNPKGWEVELANIGKDYLEWRYQAQLRPFGGLEISPFKENMRHFKNEVGWAYTARPGVSKEEMIKDMRRIKDMGSTVVYLGHNNPGDTDPNKSEPGLSFAVYYAIQHKTGSQEGARQMYTSIVWALDAAKEVGLDVVLPVGYQIQMGPEWNNLHWDDARRNQDGSLMNHWGSGETASPYSPDYWRDVTEYYNWVNEQLINKYPNIVAINIGDEPMGTDYSTWAKSAFKERYGTDFDSAGDFQRGQFLSSVIADYLSQSAKIWEDINSQVWVTSTLHIQRDKPWLPDIEAIFEKTGDNFVVSADTHLHDAPMDWYLTPEDVNLLKLMTRTLGWYSQVYNKPLMLWTSSNAWGLAGRSPKPGGIPEAELNVSIVNDETKRTGGIIAMVFGWGINIKDQDMPDMDRIIEAVNNKMSVIKDGLSTTPPNSPETVLYVGQKLYETIGKEKPNQLLDLNINLQGQYGKLIENSNTIILRDGEALKQAMVRGAMIVPIY
ncbi:MAG: hypothetical protein M1450_00040 [Patescibacteria group bacterium]|nr:hypothetical protein [Patescibacteria group bacterium]